MLKVRNFAPAFLLCCTVCMSYGQPPLKQSPNVTTEIPQVCRPDAEQRPDNKKPDESYWHKAVKPDILPVWFGGLAALLASIAGLLTLGNLKEQARVGLLAANAAKDSAEIAIKSERAWVVDEIRQMENLPILNEVFAVYLTFKNFGGIPAQIMGLKVRFRTFRFKETDPLVGGEPLPEFPAYDDGQIFFEIGDRGIVLAPNQSLTIAQPFEEEGGKWTNFLALVVPPGQRRLCCYGLISYMDGFGTLRTNQFCYIWDPGFDPKGVIPNFRRFGPSNYNHAT
jgi:hypothetical protein